jgi:hypothetical protein
MIHPIRCTANPLGRARRLYSCWFGDGHWARMATALSRSAEAHCPTWDRAIERIYSDASGKYETNVAKLHRWASFVLSCNDGDEVCLIDSDCFVARPLDAVWSQPFDLAVTFKGTVRLPFNAGVVFLRVNGRTRSFMSEWYGVNHRMMGDRTFHLQYERTYSGINQAALGYMLEREGGLGDVDLARIPAAEWTACAPQFWTATDARVYHLKSTLRQQAQAGLQGGPYAHALRLWHGYAKG